MVNLKLKIAVLLFTLLYFFSSTAAPVLAAISYLYDQNGNMASDGTKCYEYNEANQLTKVKNCSNSETIAEYVYDHQGNRLVKKEYENGALKQTVYSPSDEYETVKLASDGTTQNTSYYFVNDQLIAKKNPDGSKNYYHNDHLGSTSVMTSQTGTLVEETKYDPWGEVKTGGTASKFLYTGQEKDLETGLNYYNARYYDSHIRRFTQPDDIIQNVYHPQSLNRYSYVRNNPLRYTDPTGNFSLSAVLGIIQSYLQPAISVASNIVAKVFSNPTTTKVVQTANKVQSNTVTNKVENNAGKIINNPTVNKMTSNVGNAAGAGSSTAINIGTSSLTHVLNRHVAGGIKSAGKSIFSNSKEITTLVRSAESVEPILQENGKLRRIIDAGRIIGIDRTTGQPTSWYTVITDATNSLVTTHPGLP